MYRKMTNHFYVTVPSTCISNCVIVGWFVRATKLFSFFFYFKNFSFYSHLIPFYEIFSYDRSSALIRRGKWKEGKEKKRKKRYLVRRTMAALKAFPT